MTSILYKNLKPDVAPLDMRNILDIQPMGGVLAVYAYAEDDYALTFYSRYASNGKGVLRDIHVTKDELYAIVGKLMGELTRG